MSYALVAVLAVLVLLNMLLTLGVVRRLNSQTGGASTRPNKLFGQVVPDIDGDGPDGPRSLHGVLDDVGRPAVLAFLHGSCSQCVAASKQLHPVAEAAGAAGVCLVVDDGPGVDQIRRHTAGRCVSLLVDPARGGEWPERYDVHVSPWFLLLNGEKRVVGEAPTLVELEDPRRFAHSLHR